MKKILASLALVAFAAAASAGVTGFTSYDYNGAVNSTGSTQELATGVVIDVPVGKVDFAIIGNRVRMGGQDDQLGGEVGYSYGMKVGPGTLTGRAALGRKNFRAGAPGLQYYSLGAEFTAPVADKLGAFVGFRTRNAFNGTGGVENRVSAGIDYAFTKDVSARVGYAHTTANGQKFNGLMTSISYSF